MWTPKRWKVSDFQDFAGKEILLAAQQRGIEIMGDKVSLQAADVMLFGLASILAQHNIGGINEIAKGMPKPPKGKADA